MNRIKNFEGLIKIPREEKRTCQKIRQRFYKYGSFNVETNLPCGKRARWSYKKQYYCVNCWSSMKGELAKSTAKKKPKAPKASDLSNSKINIPRDQTNLRELAQKLEKDLGRAKSVKEFLAHLNDFNVTNRDLLVKEVERHTKSFSLAHLLKLEWKIR